MRCAFQAFLVLFGVVVIGISLAHLAVGPAAIIGGTDVNPTSDGEDRFYAGLFLAYGVALLWCARDVQRKRAVLSGGRFSSARHIRSTSRCWCSSWCCRC